MYVCSICSSASILIAIVMSSIDVETGMYIAMLSLCMLLSYQLFPGLYFQCDCDGIASPLCTDLVQACILCTCPVGEYTTLYIVAAVKGLQHFC